MTKLTKAHLGKSKISSKGSGTGNVPSVGYGKPIKPRLTKAQEKRKSQVSILANMVFRFQGSDPKIKRAQVGLEGAAETLDEIIADELSLQKKKNRERLKELPTIGGNSAGTRDDEYISLDQAIKSIK